MSWRAAGCPKLSWKELPISQFGFVCLFVLGVFLGWFLFVCLFVVLVWFGLVFCFVLFFWVFLPAGFSES